MAHLFQVGAGSGGMPVLDMVCRDSRLRRVTLVEPSAFRTDFLSDHSIRRSTGNLKDYAGTAGASRDRLAAMAGKQPGDPARAAAAIIQAVDSPEPPLHLVLGADAYQRTRQMLDAFSAEVEAWKAVSIGADFPDPH